MVRFSLACLAKRQDRLTTKEQKVQLYKYFDRQLQREERSVKRAERQLRKKRSAEENAEARAEEMEAGSAQDRRAIRARQREARFGEDGDDFREIFDAEGVKFSARYKPPPKQEPCWWKSAWGILPSAERFADMGAVDAVLAAVDERRIDTRAPFLYQHFLEKCIAGRAIEQGRKVHAHIIKNGLSQDRNFSNLLVQMYGACREIEDAVRVFTSIAYKNTRSYAVMISAYSDHGDYRKALDLFHRMVETLEPDDFVLSTALHAAGMIQSLEDGRAIHKWILDSEIKPELALENSILEMYARCGDLPMASQLFTAMPARNSASWSVLIAGYIEGGEPEEGLKLYKRIQHGVHRVDLSAATIVLLVRACGELDLLEEGGEIHRGLNERELGYPGVAAALMEMYARCGIVDDARKLFDQLPQRDLVAWNSMIAVYARTGHPREALELYEKLDLSPDKQTYLAMLLVYADLGDLDRGHRIRLLLDQTDSDLELQAAIVSFYARCGAIREARGVFDRIRQRDAACWTAMIHAYVAGGEAARAIELFREMSVEPSAETYAIVLWACSIAGDAATGKALDEEISRTELRSNLLVQNSLVGMYARSGQLMYAKWEFDRIACRDCVSWNILLGAYAQLGHCREALELFPQMPQEGVAPDGVTFVAVLCCYCRIAAAPVGEEWWEQFVRMVADFGIAPWVEHYACVIELLGRAGKLGEAEELVRTMPFEAEAEQWSALLASCRAHGDDKRAARSAYRIAEMEGAAAAAG
ncbi:pentatricopeptide repeat-containing protein At1g06140, mitochondrial [Selaginella moellendorffii]|uniref:pentatricopeptide repeat-containing protein At1g06140, mitochondrial n=1 Tax=Selaginella moellendorffii TaxID=88036 RepID=UPI000D1D0E7B|nr:pentatricopeptide repeat-containing protein At1g06140, mitochondrial [Selaginella moellendorffii]|eukprot:XP_024522349.1 pentatricopeptide repeat-containing protein At1g06140, mitochondrial [Selaginella moellendorffii]